MIKKTSTAKIVQKRSVTAFFNRVMENFERKFDGFPAAPDKPTSMPAVQEGAFPDFDMQAIIDKIAKANYDPAALPCPEIPGGCDETVDGCVVETFQDTTTLGTGWGTTDSGEPWDLLFSGNGTTNVDSNGSGRIFSVTSGSGTFSMSAGCSLSPSCAVAGQHGEVLAHFSCSDKTAWTSTYPHSVSAGFPTAYNVPGRRHDPDQPDDNLEAGVARHYVQVNVSGSSGGTYARIFNSGGTLYLATKYASSIYQELPVAVGPSSDNFWVRMRVTSNGMYSVRVWDNADDEPTGWLTESVSGDWSGDQVVTGVFHTNLASFGTYVIRCNEFYVNTLDIPDCSGFSGQFTTGVTIYDGISGYSTQVDNDGIYDVFYDDMMAVKDVDYTISDRIIYPITPLDPSVVVRARYKIL